MVLLNFEITVPISLKQAWDFFADISKIHLWDPNVKDAQVYQKSKGQDLVGQIYKVTTVLKGKQSTVYYKVTQYKIQQKIVFIGDADTITSEDIITFKYYKQKQTIIQYTSDIQLKGILCLFTPCLVFTFREVQDIARRGMIEKGIQLGGGKVQNHQQQKKSKQNPKEKPIKKK